MKQRGMIFDIDGVLVDSYEAHFLSWKQLAERHGRVCTEEQFADQFGRTTREVLQVQWSNANLSDDDLSRLDDEKEALFRDVIADQFPEMPGATEFIHQLIEAGWKIGLGSSGPEENVSLAVEKLNLERKVEAAISGNDVTKGKPAPEVFLKAAEKMDVAPRDCIVIEDASHGIEAAHRAGMKAIGFVSRGRTREELAAADLLVERFDELSMSVLEDLLARGRRE